MNNKIAKICGWNAVAVYNYISDNPDDSLPNIARHVYLTAATVRSTVIKLERCGFIKIATRKKFGRYYTNKYIIINQE